MTAYALTKLRSQPFPALICDLDKFNDISWGNDCADSVCFSISGQGYFMWVDYADVAEREEASASRYWITLFDIEEGIKDSDSSQPTALLSTESAADVVAWVEAKIAERDGICECGQIEGACECPCVNCGAPMSMHGDVNREMMPGTDCPADTAPPLVFVPLLGILGTLGTEVMFHAGASKVIDRSDLELYLKCGRVTSVGPDYLEVRLNEHLECLDEWDNTLIWTVEDCLSDERMENWDYLSDLQKCSFFEGYLAAMVTE